MNQLSIPLDRRFIFAVLIIVAFVLRIYNLNFGGLWNDELFTARTANPGMSIDEVVILLQLDIHPPLHNILSNFWCHLFSYTDTSLRMFNVLWGVFGVLSLYQLAKLLFNKNVAFIALLLVIVNSYLIGYSQEVRAYMMLFVLINYSVYYFVRLSRDEHSWRNIIAYGLFTAAMLYTHYFGMLVMAFQGIVIFFLIGYKTFLKDLKIWIISFLIPLILYSLWIPSMIKSFNRDYNVWRDKGSITLLYEYFIEFFNDYILSTLSLVLFLVTLVVLIFLKHLKNISWLTKEVKKYRATLVLLIIWLVIYFAVPLIKSYVSNGIMSPKYFIGMLPPVLLILAFYISLINKKKTRNILLTGIIIYSFLILFLKQRPYYIQTTSYREIAKTASEINNNAYVLYISKQSQYFKYYINQYNLGKQRGNLKPFVELLERDKPEEYFLFLDLRLTPNHFNNGIPVVDGYEEISAISFKNISNVNTVRLIQYKRKDPIQ